MRRITQLSLFDDGEDRDHFDTDEETIQAAFEAFDRHNPHVYDLFKRLCIRLRRTHTHYSAKAIYERMRHHYKIAQRQTLITYKLSNNFHSRYARKLVAEDPSFARFLQLRKLRSR